MTSREKQSLPYILTPSMLKSGEYHEFMADKRSHTRRINVECGEAKCGERMYSTMKRMRERNCELIDCLQASEKKNEMQRNILMNMLIEERIKNSELKEQLDKTMNRNEDPAKDTNKVDQLKNKSFAESLGGNKVFTFVHTPAPAQAQLPKASPTKKIARKPEVTGFKAVPSKMLHTEMAVHLEDDRVISHDTNNKEQGRDLTKERIQKSLLFEIIAKSWSNRKAH
ncbi:hypothetical protein BDB01DRAFT_837921 [Pilobolus umbonatus]|nr:hypothetical protein BDB01DRAFT_837921 [Pilobolus umbonatus]